MEVVRAYGLEIAYERVGEGPPLVFVHGAAEDGRIWQRQLASLADEFTVVAWDEPGAGRSSDLPADFGLEDYANCLAALIEELALGPAHVAGLSWGGTVVQELYRHHPGLVATLILVDTYAGWKGSLPEKEVRLRVAGARRMLAAPAEKFDPTLPGLFAADPPREVAALLEEIAAAVRPETLRAQLSAMAEADQRDLLPRIAVPTLLVWGELDVRSPLNVARQFEQAIPDTKLVVIPRCGHVSHLEQPERFSAAVREFCLLHSPAAPSGIEPGYGRTVGRAPQVLPERVEDGGVLLRRWRVEDAEALGGAVSESREHLRPWMDFVAREPMTLDERKAMMRNWEREWLQGGDVLLGIFVAEQVAGSCGLHRRRGPAALEIGYWVHPAHTGRGLATAVARLLTGAAFSVAGVTHVEIHTDKANAASSAVPRRLGFRFLGETPDEATAPAEVGIDCGWRMDQADWSGGKRSCRRV